MLEAVIRSLLARSRYGEPMLAMLRARIGEVPPGDNREGVGQKAAVRFTQRLAEDLRAIGEFRAQG